MKIAFIRHTAVDCAPGVCYGRLDLPLHADSAARDIAAVVERLSEFGTGRVWSSPALRCRRLAEALPATPGGPALDDRLLELDLGAWEGRPWKDVPRAELDRWAADPLGFAAPGGESGAALVARVADFFEALRAQPGDHLVVSYGGPLRVLTALARRLPVDLLVPAPPLGSVQIIRL